MGSHRQSCATARRGGLEVNPAAVKKHVNGGPSARRFLSLHKHHWGMRFLELQWEHQAEFHVKTLYQG